MHQGEQNRAHSGYPGPAVCSKKLQQLRAFYFYQTSSRHIGHDDDGNDNFIGRKSQKKAGQDASIHPQGSGKGIQKAGEGGEKSGLVIQMHVGQDPDDQAGRSSRYHGAPEDLYSTIYNASYNYL